MNTRLGNRILLAAILAIPLMLAAQPTASKAFVQAPRDVFPLLERNTRLDMIDYYNSGSSTGSKNNLEGLSRITSLSDTAMVVEMTGSTTYQLALLPVGKSDTLTMVIRTVALPALDSDITFYDKNWNMLNTEDIFKEPNMMDWLLKKSNASENTASMYVPFMVAKADYNPANGELTLVNTLDDYLDSDTQSKIMPLLRKSISYKWKGKRFWKR